MKATQQVALLVVLLPVSRQAAPGSASITTATSAAHPWEYTLTVAGYFVSKGAS